ncbi:MAG TPA: endospore germination permease [Bacillota bacterium]|nr:endospore germination permease [Bacillota bacterium]
MLAEKTGIGPGLLFMVVYSTIIGYGLIQGPYIAAKFLGTAGYWGVILAFLPAMAVIFLVVALGRRFPGESIIGYSQSVCGKFLGKVIGISFIVFILALVAWTIQDISDHFNIYLTPRTPIWMIVALVLFTVLCIAYKGIEGLSRTAAFLFILPLMFIILTALTSFQFFRIHNILPVFHIHPDKLPLGIIHTFNSFLPLGGLFIIYQYLTDQAKGFKSILGAAGLACFFIFIATFESIGVYGAKGVLIYSWPFLELGKETNIPYISQTFGLFISPVLLIEVVLGSGALFYAAAQGLSELWDGSKSKYFKYKYLLLILTPIIFIVVILTPDVVIVRKAFDYLRVIGFIFVFVLPLLIWVMAVLLRKGVKRHAS